MACLVGYGAYRYEVVDHVVPVRVIGPDGRQSKQHSRACSWIWERERDKEKARRWIRAHLTMLNDVHNAAANDNFDVAERFVESVDGCREVMDKFVAVHRIKSQSSVDRDGSMWLRPTSKLYGKVSNVLIATGMVTQALTLDGVFVGQDPSKVDRSRSRIGGKGREIKMTPRGIRSDTDNRLRVGRNPAAVPRFDDPRVYDRLKLGLELTGAAEPFGLCCDLAHGAGGRAMSILRLDLFDALVRPKQEGHYPAPNKGDDPDERNFVMIPPDHVHKAILAWIDGGLRRLTGKTLDQLRRIAADPLRQDELRGQPLFTENGSDFIKYNRLYRVVRRAAERMDLYIADDLYLDTRKKRFITFHLLRHEYVHGRLDGVDLMKGKAEKEAGRKAIIAYMRWAGSAMLDWYSQHHTVKLAVAAAETHNRNQDKLLEGAAHSPVGHAANDGLEELDDVVAAFG